MEPPCAADSPRPRKDLVFYTDGDGQYDPGELSLLLSRLEPQVGLVNGYKIKRNDPLYRILIGKNL